MVKGIKLVVDYMGTACFHSFFSRAIQYRLKCFVLCLLFLQYIIVLQWRSWGHRQVRADWWRVSQAFKYFLICLLLLYTTHISIHAIYTYCCYCWLYQSPLCCPLQNNQNIPYLVAIVDCTQVGTAIASFEELVPYHRRTLQQIYW